MIHELADMISSLQLLVMGFRSFVFKFKLLFEFQFFFVRLRLSRGRNGDDIRFPRFFAGNKNPTNCEDDVRSEVVDRDLRRKIGRDKWFSENILLV